MLLQPGRASGNTSSRLKSHRRAEAELVEPPAVAVAVGAAPGAEDVAGSTGFALSSSSFKPKPPPALLCFRAGLGIVGAGAELEDEGAEPPS